MLTYGFFKTDELFCLFPVFYKQQYSVKMLFSPPPRASIPYLGYALKDTFYDFNQEKQEEYLKIIYDDFSKTLEQLNPDYIFISFMPDIIDTRQLIWGGYDVNVNYTYILDLSSDIDTIWKGINIKKRSKIRKAEELNIKIVETDKSDLVFGMISKRYIEQGLTIPLYSKDYLNELRALFPDNICIHLVKNGEDIVGSEVVLWHNDTYMDWLGSVRPEGKIPVNELLTWENIKKCKQEGILKIDFVGANKEGIATYKSKFGPKLTAFYTVRKQNIRGKFAESVYLRLLKRRFF